MRRPDFLRESRVIFPLGNAKSFRDQGVIVCEQDARRAHFMTKTQFTRSC